MISGLSIDRHFRNYDFGKHRSDWAVVGKVLRFPELTLCTNIILYTRRTCCVLEADETNFCLSPSRKSHIPPHTKRLDPFRADLSLIGKVSVHDVLRQLLTESSPKRS